MTAKAKEFVSKYGPLIFLMVFYTVFHIALSPGYWDDKYFKDAMEGSIVNLFPFLYSRYKIWSPRVIIELVIGILSLLPYAVWKILNLLMILLLYKDIEWFMEKIFSVDDLKSKWALTFLLCSLPFSIMACTGWLATTMNYLWVISLGLYAVNTIIKDVIFGEKLSIIEKVLIILAVLYSGNFESVAVLTLFGVAAAIFYQKCIKKKNVSGILWIVLLIAFSLLLGVILCPGNKNRLASDIERWMPDYIQMNLFDKLRMGIITAYMHFVSIPSPIFFILNSVCLISVILKKGNMCQRIIAAFPVILDGLWTCYYMINYFTGQKAMTYQVPEALLTGGTDMAEQLVMFTTVVIWFVSFIYSLYWIFEGRKDFFLCCGVLLVGCIPEIVVGMSATVVNSMLRTVLYLYLSMVILILSLWREIQIFWKQFRWLQIATYFVFFCGVALNAIQMTRHILIYG